MRTTMSALLTVALLAAGCGSAANDGDDAGARQSDAAPDVEAEIEMFEFEPDVIEIEAGQTVRWTNGDATRHTVTAGEPDGPTGAFDIFLEDRGSRATVTFDEPGEYHFFCQPHSFMTGSVVVTE